MQIADRQTQPGQGSEAPTVMVVEIAGTGSSSIIRRQRPPTWFATTDGAEIAMVIAIAIMVAMVIAMAIVIATRIDSRTGNQI